MSIARNLQNRLFIVGGVAVAATFAAAGVAVASNATKGATYVGTYNKGGGTEAIEFKVSSSGKRVIDLTVTTPFKCQGGCGGVGSPNEGSARISKAGKFKVTLKIKEPGASSKSIGTDKVTGTFLKHGEAKGTVTSHFNKSSSGENRQLDRDELIAQGRSAGQA